MKTCLKCGQEKTLAEFLVSANGKPTSPCSSCFAKHRKDRYRTDAAFRNACIQKSRDRYATKKAQVAAGNKVSVERRIAEDGSNWTRTMAVAKYRHKKRVTGWYDRDAVAKFYREAAVLTKNHGIPYHVDHIVPINSKFVCGLHNQFNLQVLKWCDNAAKGNLRWPDMPVKQEEEREAI